jgi:hypothetical protein
MRKRAPAFAAAEVKGYLAHLILVTKKRPSHQRRGPEAHSGKSEAPLALAADCGAGDGLP